MVRLRCAQRYGTKLAEHAQVVAVAPVLDDDAVLQAHHVDVRDHNAPLNDGVTQMLAVVEQ